MSPPRTSRRSLQTGTARLPGDIGGFWQTPVPELLATLGVTGEGLSSAEARERLARFGPNALDESRRLLGFLEPVRRVLNPLILILLSAALVSGIVGEVVNAVVISVMVSASIGIDVYQTRRSAEAARRLRQRVESRATVKRDGSWTDIPFNGVVPGDRLHLRAGDIIPADARILTSGYLLVDEAAFTGESVPVEKEPADSVQASRAADAANSVFMGTVVAGGSAEALVVRTGSETAYARIAGQLSVEQPQTAFDRGLRGFGLLIARTVAVLVVFVLAVNLIEHRAFLDSLLFAIALAVGLTPEFLPMILTVTQAEGALHMSRSKVIVRELAAIQNLGNLDVICSDKTGTLTEGRMAVERAVDIEGEDSPRVRRLAYWNAALQTDIRSPFDEALVSGPESYDDEIVRVGELPFDFERRRLSVAVSAADQRFLITKGAPESVLDVCGSLRTPGGVADLDDAARFAARALMEDLGSRGMRVLGVATVALVERPALSLEDEKGMTIEGFVAFSDPPKEGVGEVLRALEDDGIRLKVLTGDAEAVTAHVCEVIDFPRSGRIVTGTEVAAMDDAALAETLDTCNVFARVAPDQKLRIIRGLQKQGHVVGYLGDGINDAPSLRAADVGISVEGAVDVAREAAQIVLLEKSLGVLHIGVVEGRKVFGNVMKYIMMGTSSNFGNMLSMAGAVLFLPFLPLLPSQVLLNNALYDFAQISIPTDRVDDETLRRPRGWDLRFIRDFMIVFGPISSLYDFLTFYVLRSLFHADEKLFHTGWFIESLATQTLVIFVIRTMGNPLRSRPGIPLAATVIAIVAVGALIPWTFVAGPLGFVHIPLGFGAFVLAAVATYLLIVQSVKHVFVRFHPYA